MVGSSFLHGGEEMRAKGRRGEIAAARKGSLVKYI